MHSAPPAAASRQVTRGRCAIVLLPPRGIRYSVSNPREALAEQATSGRSGGAPPGLDGTKDGNDAWCARRSTRAVASAPRGNGGAGQRAGTPQQEIGRAHV